MTGYRWHRAHSISENLQNLPYQTLSTPCTCLERQADLMRKGSTLLEQTLSRSIRRSDLLEMTAGGGGFDCSSQQISDNDRRLSRSPTSSSAARSIAKRFCCAKAARYSIDQVPWAFNAAKALRVHQASHRCASDTRAALQRVARALAIA